MFSQPSLHSYATLVDGLGRFVESIGRVVALGKIIEIEDGRNIDRYEEQFLAEVVAAMGLKLVFLPPAVRLPAAPAQVSTGVYERITTAKLDR